VAKLEPEELGPDAVEVGPGVAGRELGHRPKRPAEKAQDHGAPPSASAA